MIYTFYSFKGGVGRSMALANIAEAFHEKGLRVLMVDWDLEAPGLEVYFYPQEPAQLKAARAHPGLIDMLVRYKDGFPEYSERRTTAAVPELAVSVPHDVETRKVVEDILRSAKDIPEFLREPLTPAAAPVRAPQSYMDFLAGLYKPPRDDRPEQGFPPVVASSPLTPYLQCIHGPTPGADNGLFLLSAGARSGQRFGPYAVAVSDFDWSEFYALYDGAAYFKWFRERLDEIADVVLIDSRTGVTEMGGVCTRFMADAVLAFCAPNFQNVDGVVSVLSGLNREQVMEVRNNRRIDVLVAPTRIDLTESQLLGEFKDRFWTAVEQPAASATAAPAPEETPSPASTTVWDQILPEALRPLDRPQWDLRIPYIPRYNYREQMVIGPQAATPDPATQELIASYQRLVTYISILAPDGNRVRTAMARELSREFPHVQPGVMICRSSAAVASLAEDLRAWLKARGISLREDLDIERGADYRVGIDLARALIVLLTPESVSSVALRDVVRYARRTGTAAHFILADGATPPALSGWLQGVEILRDDDREVLLEKLRSRGTVRRVPFMAPSAERVLSRAEPLDRLRSALAQSPRVVLYGPPGSGKSVLAALHCHEDAWDERYPGGILWLDARDLKELGPHYRTLAVALLGDDLASRDPQQNRDAVRRRLGEVRTLLVLDDVVVAGGGEAFRNLRELLDVVAAKGACLITARDATLAARISATPVVVGSLTPAESAEVLGRGVSRIADSDPRIQNISRELAASPLALALASEAAASAYVASDDPNAAIQRLQDAIHANGVVAFDMPGTADASRSVGVSIRSGLARLTAEERRRLESLAVLENPFTADEAVRTWRTSPEDAQRLLTRFSTEAFVVAAPGGLFQFDGLVGAYLRAARSRAAITPARRIESSVDRAVNPDVRRAEELLAQPNLPPVGEVQQLAERLVGQRYFDVGEQLFARARRIPGLDPKTTLRLAQRQALCTYKDQDRPADRRLDEALAILDETDPLSTTMEQETLGLAGAILKARWNLDGQVEHLERSLAYYRRGFQQGADRDFGYTGINTAFVLDLLAAHEARTLQELHSGSGAVEARRAEAKAVREEILRRVEPLASDAGAGQTWWFLVTIAEACFGLARFGEAQVWVRKALTADVTPWEYESTARQFATLAALQRESGILTPEQSIEAEETMRLLLGHDVKALASIDIGKVGLALSGGGFRASLFHVGVLARLAELDILRHVEVLSCVSGGSIVGAHYYLEVTRLLEQKADDEITREDYIEIVKRLSRDFLDGVQRNIRTRVALNPFASLKTAFVPYYSRTDRVGELYEQEIFSRVEGVRPPIWLNALFIRPKDAPEGFTPKVDNWRRSAKVPMLVLNATTLNTGHNWQFTASWMGESPAAISSEIDANDLLRRMYFWQAPKDHQRVRLGAAVAASSCVPGLFEPLVLPHLYPERTVQLVDGGVHDNQGIASLMEQDCTVMLVSDASGQLATENKPPTEMLDVLPRANNILMARVREAEYREMQARRRSGVLRALMFVHLKKDLDVAPVDWIDAPPTAVPRVQPPATSYGIPRDVQHALANIRTDLDSFSDAEAYALMLSGYRMTAREVEHGLPRFASAAGSALPRHDTSEAVPWRFLGVENAVRKERGYEEAHHALLKLLWASKSRGFKIWRLVPALAITTLVLLVAAAVAFVWRTRVDWSMLGDAAAYAGNAILIGAVLVGITSVLFRWAEVPKSATQLVLGAILSAGGWFVALMHLLFYDPLYLAVGRLAPDGPAGRPGSILRVVAGAAVPAILLLGLLVAFQAWQQSSIERLREQARAEQGGGSLQTWERVLRVFPQDPEARTGRARAYLADRDPKRALEELKPLGDVTEPGILRVRAAAYQQSGDFAAAAADLDRVLVQIRDDPQVLRDRAYARRLLGEYGGALDDYTRALAIEPNAQAEQDRTFVVWQLTRQQRAPEVSRQATEGMQPASRGPVSGPRIFIQWVPVPGVNLDPLLRRLRDEGFDIAPPEAVRAVPRQSEVRYFGEASRGQAERLAKALSGGGVPADPKPVAGPPRGERLEVWLAKDAIRAERRAK